MGLIYLAAAAYIWGMACCLIYGSAIYKYQSLYDKVTFDYKVEGDDEGSYMDTWGHFRQRKGKFKGSGAERRPK